MSLQSSVETLFRWSEDGGGRNWVCNWSNCRGNREVALEHDLLASGEASAEYENQPSMGMNSVCNLVRTL